jgi:ribosomal-protein-alanine N-acetyltransferase
VSDIPAAPDVPVLTGPRVTLRAPTIDDAELLFERVASDPEVTRYLSWTPHPNVDETRRVIAEFFNVGGETTWLIDLRDGTGPVGLCGWRRPSRTRSSSAIALAGRGGAWASCLRSYSC